MQKTDFKKFDTYHGKHHVLHTLDVPPMQYLVINGQGAPIPIRALFVLPG